ncbi:MAG: ABC transporter permease [Alphaproteobacteria bacterium]|nr:ABC transporter permease [Alphaproteobacteria bacterium]
MTGADEIETSQAEEGAHDSLPPRNSFLRRLRAEPLLPEAGAGGAPLTAVIAVISFLAVLAMAAVLIINTAAGAWTSSLRSEITVQVKGADAAEISARAEAALRVLENTDGVIEASVLSQDEAAALLEPWLGKGNVTAFLNVPSIIEVKITPAARSDLDLLRNRLKAAAPGATLDDHAGWYDRLSKAARSGQALALGVFLLVMGAACSISIFAARAGLAANHEIVSVLHLVGATDEFIAGEVQRRFFILGLRGALAGLVIALLALGLTAFAMRAGVGGDAFLPRFTLDRWLILWLFTVPVVTCLVTALTARLTVLRALREEY